MRQVIRFEPNQAVTVALEFPDGVNVVGRGGPQVRYFLTQNRIMYLDPEPARALAVLKVQPGEPFTIEKKTAKGKSPWWDFGRVKSAGASSEGGDSRLIEGVRAVGDTVPALNPPKPPAIEPSPVSAPKLAISPGEVNRIPPQSVPAPPPQPGGIHLTRTPPVKPSYEEAFRECLRIVTEGLASSREQWSDGAKQAMVSTLLIQLGRENRLGEFRPQQIGKVA